MPVLGILPAIASFSIQSQGNACQADFDRLVGKIEQNYAGYRLEVTPATQSRFKRYHDRLRAEAAKASGDGGTQNSETRTKESVPN